MKRMLITAALAAVLVGSGMAVGKSDTQRFGKIECESLTVKAPDGKGSVEITSAKDIVGIWISRAGRRDLVAIYNSDREGAVVGGDLD